MAGAFHEALIVEERELLARTDGHELFRRTADGEIDEATLRTWLTQEYLWMRDYEHFLAEMIARAPHGVRRPLLDSLLTIHGEIELVEEFASRQGIQQASSRPTFATHAYGSFLRATVHTRPFPETLTVCYAANHSWVRAWSRVLAGPAPAIPWLGEFLNLWNEERNQEWVSALERFVDSVASETTEQRRQEMRSAFRVTLHYALRFWDNVLDGSGW